MEYKIVSTLRELCIKHDFFNAGTNSQYEKMFDFAKCLVRTGREQTVKRLADVIWVCTDGADITDIMKALDEWYTELVKSSC